jgi:HK97 gp10 family phage protein
MADQIKLDGAKELSKLMTDLPPKVEKKIARKGLRKGAKVTLEAVKQEAPVDTAEMRNSLKVYSAKSKKGNVAVRVATSAKDFTGDQFYSAFNVYGTKKQPPNDFIGRGFDRTAQEAGDTIIKTVGDEIEAEARKG